MTTLYLSSGPPGYISWRNRFLGSISVYKYGLRFCEVDQRQRAHFNDLLHEMNLPWRHAGSPGVSKKAYPGAFEAISLWFGAQQGGRFECLFRSCETQPWRPSPYKCESEKLTSPKIMQFSTKVMGFLKSSEEVTNKSNVWNCEVSPMSLNNGGKGTTSHAGLGSL